jgi:hypothetical protein
LDVCLAVDAQLGDQQPEEGLGPLWLGVGDDVLEVVGDGGEVRGCRRVGGCLG